MELPKFNDTFLPIIAILRDGRTIPGRELIRLVEKKFYSDLPAELLSQTTKSGDRLLENRIAWGNLYLKKGGLVHYPQRGFVQITEKGKAAKDESISIDQLESDVIGFYQAGDGNSEKREIESSSPQDL